LTEKLSFAIENIEFLEEENNSQFATLKIDAFASGENRHKLYISDETLKKTAPTIIQKPIMWAYNRRTDDASSHDDTEIICGFIPHDTPIEFRKLEDGRTMMSVIGKLWTRYSDKLMDIFHRDKNKSVSVEMEVYEEADNTNFGMQEILNFCYTGITVLGNLITPAIPLANAELIAFASKEKEEYENALLEFSNKYGSIDMSIPKEVKVNANKGLELYKQMGIGGTSISLAVARHLIKNDLVAIEKVKSIHKFLNSRKGIPKNKNNPDGEYISWMLYGGSQAMEWSKNMISSIKEIDEKQLSYFDNGEVLTFPYKSIGDINPALKGISPPISLSQANKIAEIADSIGVSEDKNGWAIAISQFKKTHSVENGKWVKKEPASQKEELFVEEKDKELENKEEMVEKVEMAEEKTPESETNSETEPEKEEMAVEKKEDDEVSEKEEEKEDPKEDVEEEQEEKKEPKEEKMSLDGNLDVASYLAFLESTTEANEEMVAKYKTGEEFDFSKILTASKDKMAKMAEALDKAKEDNDAYMAMKEEFESLKQFKAETQSAQVAYAVESTIAEASDVLPKEKIEEFRSRAKECSIETVTGLTNEIKAFAFSCSKDKKPIDGITRFDTGWITPKQESNKYENGWV
jgi:hypothetical protein